MSEFLNALTSGLGVGSVYAFVALAFSFIYRATGSFNFAQGQLVTFGSLFAYSLYTRAKLPAIVALIATVAIVAGLGGVTERVAFWPLARVQDHGLLMLISTLGIGVLLTGGAERLWGTTPLGVPNYVGPNVIHFNNAVFIATPYIIAVGSVLLVSVGLEIFQRFTLWGRMMRALADNRTAIELAGVNVRTLALVTFALGGALAGLAGFVLAPVTYATSAGGFTFMILAFAGFALGGFASHWGAVLGGMLLGVLESEAGTYLGLNYQDMIVFVVLVAILWWRPEGLITSRAVRGV
jgi:branched-subunit amino acid ABC-type transport system permease component